ncbi:MAG: hypothetical protein GF346_02050 [Candidatus Eisenbacteria bacterium]|nr:hypothetical protein [Candidatus Latescibacterota bacterium]MBD3301214.1 hypothetical protein [Candidatus Eisenbacteria bacterium]
MSIPCKLRYSIALPFAIAVLVFAGCSSDEASAPLSMNPLDEVPPLAPADVEVTKTYATKFLLDWESNTEPDLAGYRVYLYSPDPDRAQSYLLLNNQGLLNRSQMIMAGESGATYIFRVTAVDGSGNEGAWSPMYEFQFSPSDAQEEGETRLPDEDIPPDGEGGEVHEPPYDEMTPPGR